mgnify:CR=1 FL=1
MPIRPMNWQAVVDMLRDDEKLMLAAMREAVQEPQNHTGAMIAGVSATLMASLANALQMGINKRDAP